MLQAKLNILILAGQKDGDLEWIGTSTQWDAVKNEEESILRDATINYPDDMDDTCGDRDMGDFFNSNNDLPDWAVGMDL